MMTALIGTTIDRKTTSQQDEAQAEHEGEDDRRVARQHVEAVEVRGDVAADEHSRRHAVERLRNVVVAQALARRPAAWSLFGSPATGISTSARSPAAFAS